MQGLTVDCICFKNGVNHIPADTTNPDMERYGWSYKDIFLDCLSHRDMEDKQLLSLRLGRYIHLLWDDFYDVSFSLRDR